MSSSFRPSSQHKPMLVRTPTFGTGVVSERRADVAVVKLPWGTVYLDQAQLTVLSSQYKRNRYDESEAQAEEQSAVRRKAAEQQMRTAQQQQPFQFQFPDLPQPQSYSTAASAMPAFQFQCDTSAPMLS